MMIYHFGGTKIESIDINYFSQQKEQRESLILVPMT